MDVVGILGKIGFDSKVFLFNLVNFLILAVLLKKFLFDKLTGVMEERQQIIADGVNKFEKSEEYLVQAQEKGKDIVDEARQEGKKIIKTSVKESEEAVEEVQIKSKQVFEEEKLRNAAKLNRQKEQMIEEFKEEASTYLVAEMKGKI